MKTVMKRRPFCRLPCPFPLPISITDVVASSIGTLELSPTVHNASLCKRDAGVHHPERTGRMPHLEKLRKQPSGNAMTMRSTTGNQGISIDFGFMVQKSRDKKRHHNLIGLNSETCYALITSHYSGQLYGRAFSTKAPPVDWINSWFANNAPSCPNKYVCMDGGGELGMSRDIHQTFANFGYAVELTGLDSSNQNGPSERPHQTIGDALRAMLSGANLQPRFRSYAFYHYVRCTTLSHTVLGPQVHMKCAVLSFQTCPNCKHLDAVCMSDLGKLAMVNLYRTLGLAYF